MSRSLIRKTQLHPDVSDLVGQYGSGYFISNQAVVYQTGNQTISGLKTFVNSGIFNSGIDLRGSRLINFTQDLVNVNSNFVISGNFNSDFVLANSSSQITGTIVSGNLTGFNASIIQIGIGNVLITGSGSNVIINSFGNRFRTSGQFAQINVLHTGNNGYIMYGNTAV
jgi:hypothetical protein